MMLSRSITLAHTFRRQSTLIQFRRFKKKKAKKQNVFIEQIATPNTPNRAPNTGLSGNNRKSLALSEDEYSWLFQMLKSFNITTPISNYNLDLYDKADSIERESHGQDNANLANPQRSNSEDTKTTDEQMSKSLEMTPKPNAPDNCSFNHSEKIAKRKISVFTDASGSYGAGGYCGEKWFCCKWPEHIKSNPNKGTRWMELFPITVAARLFGPDWKNCQVQFHTDNKEVVRAWNETLTKCKPGEPKLIEELKAAAKKYQFEIKITHIDGKDNAIADAMSRGKELPPHFKRDPVVIPNDITKDLLSITESRSMNLKKTNTTNKSDKEVYTSDVLQPNKQRPTSLTTDSLNYESHNVRSLSVYTDASKKHGSGGFYGPKWFYVEWPEDVRSSKKLNPTFMAMFPITLATRLLGPELSPECHINFFTHNTQIVKAWKTDKPIKSTDAAKLLEDVKIVAKQYRLNVNICPVLGSQNSIADAISRGRPVPKEFNAEPIQVSSDIVMDLLLMVRKRKGGKIKHAA